MNDATEGFREYRARAMRSTVGGGVVIAIGGALMLAFPFVGLGVATLGALAFINGTVGLVRVGRVRRLASWSGWHQRKAAFRVAGGGNGQPALLLEGDDRQPEAILSVATTAFRWNVLRGEESLWVTGDPLTRFAAVATPDFKHVIVVKRPLVPWWGRRLHRIATRT